VRDMAYDRYSRLHHPRIHDCHRQQDFSLPQDLSAKLRTQRKMHERHKRYKIVECSFHATTTIDSLVGIENPEEELTEAIHTTLANEVYREVSPVGKKICAV
jgi:hypothetical protein